MIKPDGTVNKECIAIVRSIKAGSAIWLLGVAEDVFHVKETPEQIMEAIQNEPAN